MQCRVRWPSVPGSVGRWESETERMRLSKQRDGYGMKHRRAYSDERGDFVGG